MSKINREQFEAWGMSDTDLRITLECETYAGIAWLAWQAATNEAEAQLTALTSQLESVVAENAALKDGAIKAIEDIQCFYDSEAWHVSEDGESETAVVALDDAKGSVEHFVINVETPATSAFLAEVRASARNEGINYAAGRLSAAFNAGFVDKPLAEVCDVVRMILDAKEDLANSRLPADDGLSGEYAEKFLAEFAAQLRQGGAV